MARTNPFIRSKLFVPGTRPERFAKALASGADAVSFDLEDSVAADAKAAAREHVAAALAAGGAGASGPLLIVRVNAPDSAGFDADLRAVVRAGTGWINVPKVESAAAVTHVAQRIAALEAEHGVTTPIGLLVNIETPAALRRAADLGAHPRVVGLQLGLGDLFEAAGIDRRDAANVHAAMFALRLAAAEAGVFAYDGAWPDIADADGLRAEARLAQRLGFAGKSCIHPAQVAVVNAAFAPAEADVAAARRIVAAAATHGSGGVFIVDGRMIDAPFLRRAQAVVAAAAAAQNRDPDPA